MFNCPKCKSEVLYEHRKDHVRNKCEHLQIVCPAGCDTTKFESQKDLYKHILYDCRKVIRSCACCETQYPTMIIRDKHFPCNANNRVKEFAGRLNASFKEFEL